MVGGFLPSLPSENSPPANSLCGIERWGVYTIFVPTSLETRPALCGKFPLLFLSWNLSSVQCVPEKTLEENNTQMFLNKTKQNIINQSHDSKSKLKSVTNKLPKKSFVAVAKHQLHHLLCVDFFHIFLLFCPEGHIILYV